VLVDVSTTESEQHYAITAECLGIEDGNKFSQEHADPERRQATTYAADLGAIPWQDHGPWRIRGPRRIVEPMPPPMAPADLIKLFPKASERWAARLVHAVLTRAGEPLAGLSLSQIAGRYVPKHVQDDALGFILATTTTGKSGRGQQTMASMARLLLDPKRTAEALAEWRARIAPKPARPQPTLDQIKPSLDFFRGWKPKQPTVQEPYALPTASLLQTLVRRTSASA
jgi:hypothetical protein